MRTYYVKKDKRIIARLFIYFNDKIKNKEELIKYIIKEIRHINSIGYAGYLSKNAFKKFLLWVISNDNNLLLKIKEEECINIIKETLKYYSNILEYEKIINIFVFPTTYSEIINKLKGVEGYCTWKNTILLFIHPINNWKNSIKKVIGHELAHSLSEYYHKKNTLGEWIIFEGIAENFREHFDKSKSNIINSISKEKALKIFNEIRNNLDRYNEKLYNQLFYEGKKYPLWSGYAIGYFLVKEYLKRQNNIKWDKFIKINPKDVLKELNL